MGKKFPNIKKLECSLPRSQQPAIVPYPETDELEAFLLLSR
jgi:hypothetical protein